VRCKLITDKAPRLKIRFLSKSFVLHHQSETVLDVLDDIQLEVSPGECVCLNGASGTGKSSLLRCIYGNYRASNGDIYVQHLGKDINLVAAEPRQILEIRRQTLGYVTQFLRVIPRVPTIDVVAEPLLERGMSLNDARDQSADILQRLNIDEKLWPLAPATFSGGEQQRINIARSFIAAYPIMLLDEPTSALDASNRDEVMGLIQERLEKGSAMLGIFHDEEVRDRVSTRLFNMPIRE